MMTPEQRLHNTICSLCTQLVSSPGVPHAQLVTADILLRSWLDFQLWVNGDDSSSLIIASLRSRLAARRGK